jgi:hypothetical protein
MAGAYMGCTHKKERKKSAKKSPQKKVTLLYTSAKLNLCVGANIHFKILTLYKYTLLKICIFSNIFFVAQSSIIHLATLIFVFFASNEQSKATP